ncbi:MAG: chromosome segregation protein SMC [Clostridiales bacterium]|nr:chromosome segregation protein SMC [Clostridiales bacterium]
MELYGFKSFAQRTEIVFDEGITGIVGPNGSGKSNIGDAVRWVLGEQSAKTLRGASMSDVIFNGTQKRKPLSYCEVSLVFDNEDGQLPMQNAEVMVTRRVYRNGESEYFLNRAACRLRDIIDLFRDTGIGKEGYSIIGQGRIDEILSRKSEDRRQVFEEAAGIVKFRARKEEADKKLQHTLENVERLDDILEELTRRLGPLEEQSRNARLYMEYAEKLKFLDMNLFLIRSDRARQRLAELDSELMTLSTILADCEAAVADKTARRDATQERIAELDAQITAARSELMACAERVHESQEQLSALRSRQETRRENRDRITAEQTDAALRLQELEASFGASQEEVSSQEKLIATAQEMLEKAQSDLERLQAEESAADASLEEHKAAIISAMNRASDVKNQQTRLTTMQGQMTARLSEIDASAQQLHAQEAELVDEVEAARQLVQQEQQRQEALQQAHAEKVAAFNTHDAALNHQRTRAEELSAKLQSAKSRHSVLTEMVRDMEGYSQAVRRAVQYASQRGIRGVKGVLAQLMTVPQQYETAIDMALGAAQQNIVTDTEETAKELIGYLRQNRLGRATFLPMSAIRPQTLHPSARSVLSMPGCIGVASELVQCAPEYRAIIENLLGRTIIADNLDHGIPIMRAGGHSFRLVTLEGDVMHSGGSMTGGSAQSKVSNFLSRERELKELTEKLQAGQRELDAMKRTLQEGQQRKAEMRQAISDALEAVHQQEIAVTREQARFDSASEALAAHRDRMAQTEQAAVQLRESIADIERQLSSIDVENDGATMDQAAMEARTAQLQKALSAARAASAQASDRVMSRTLQLSELRHGLDNLRRDQSHFDADRHQILREQERRAAQLSEMDALDQQDEAAIAQAAQDAETRQRAQRQQEQTALAIEARRNEAQGQLRELLHEIEGLHESYKRDGEKQHRLEMNRQRVEGEQRNLENRIWDTYKLTYAGAEEFRQAEGFNEREADKQAGELNAAIRALGNVNVGAVEEYAQTKARVDDLTAQQSDLRAAEADLRELIERLLEQMRVTFVDNFTRLQGYFSETFTRLFGGGKAELILMDPEDPLNCGIEVNAQPPGKKLQLLSLLSGGERALTAIAILFATLKLKPTPFCILDEIEAALDDANIGYYADYLREYSKGTQFIVVTHRKGTMERCNALFGVAMEEQGVSKMVSVSLQDYKE